MTEQVQVELSASRICSVSETTRFDTISDVRGERGERENVQTVRKANVVGGLHVPGLN